MTLSDFRQAEIQHINKLIEDMCTKQDSQTSTGEKNLDHCRVTALEIKISTYQLPSRGHQDFFAAHIQNALWESLNVKEHESIHFNLATDSSAR